MTRSVAILLHADEYLGEGAAQGLAIKQRGYVWCAFTPAQAATLQADVEHLHSVGMTHIEYLDANEVAYRFGWLGKRVIGAKYDPTAGWLDSNALVHRYVSEINAPASQILMGVESVKIRVENGQVRGVETPGGLIAAPKVVIAAGAYARAIARTAGIELPIVIRPRMSVTTGWRHAEYPEQGPMLIGSAPFPHVRPEAGSGAIFGWEYTWQSRQWGKQYGTNQQHDALREPVDRIDQLKDARFPSLTLALMARQFGHQEGEGFGDSRYLRGMHHNIGYYVSRDSSVAYRVDEQGEPHGYDSERAIMDAVPGIDGLFVSVAHVGHGIMSSPAAGEIIACKVLGLPLPNPLFADFGFDVPWVEHDENAL
ncbi:MAG TPA: FAD-binding oxidoreductase, partial [Phototrophicaceae bacterium]|nr:FAD-binding oxidoreductase [Phototrophicaceae bacterium]